MAANNVLENLNQDVLSDDERKTVLINAFRGTRLEILVREYEKNRSAMGFRDEQLKVEEMIEHMLYVLRTEETDAMTSRPTHDAGVII